MRFRRDAPAVLIGAVVLVIATTTVLSNQLFSGLTSSVEESQFQLMRVPVLAFMTAIAFVFMAKM